MVKSIKRLASTLVILSVMSQATSVLANPEHLRGIYYDNIHHLNVRYGLAFQSDTLNDLLRPSKYDDQDLPGPPPPSYYLYGDVLAGKDSQAISFGIGQFHLASLQRFGFSFINQEDRQMYGLEGVMSAWFISLKTGIYQETEQNNVKFMIGAGWGW